MTWLYILRLKDNKFYVGKTDKESVSDRYMEHLEGNGSEWTIKYPPIGVIEYFPLQYEFHEDQVTEQLMLDHGIENVRGGSYSQVELDRDQIRAFQRKKNGALDLCQFCGEEGHFASRCPRRKALQHLKQPGQTTLFSKKRMRDCGDQKRDSFEKKTEQKRFASISRTTEACLKCGRVGHWAQDCFAQTHISGEILSEEDDDSSSFSDSEVTGRFASTSGSSGSCFKCGRVGHWAQDCFAKTHISGEIFSDEGDDFSSFSDSQVYDSTASF